jgi:hypothetical protein
VSASAACFLHARATINNKPHTKRVEPEIDAMVGELPPEIADLDDDDYPPAILAATRQDEDMGAVGSAEENGQELRGT